MEKININKKAFFKALENLDNVEMVDTEPCNFEPLKPSNNHKLLWEDGFKQGIKDTLQVLRNQGYDIVYTSEEIEDKLKQIQSQKNPITTAEGVKIGGKSRITPQVMPEKVLTQSSDTIFQKEIETDAKRLNEIYDEKVLHKKGCYGMFYDEDGRCIKCGVQIQEEKNNDGN